MFNIFVIDTPSSLDSEPILEGIEVREHEFELEVDRDISIKELLGKGSYSTVDRNIVNDRNFPHTQSGKKMECTILLEFKNTHPRLCGFFNRESALEEIERRGLRLGDIASLLSLGASTEDLQLQNGIIIALGSPCTLRPEDDPFKLDTRFLRGETVVPTLTTLKHGRTRDVDTVSIDKVFYGGTRILAMK